MVESVRTDASFTSGSETCAAWLYSPTGSEPSPVVVMAHGLGGVREMRLDAYAERFVDAGYAVLLFDYRHFGASGGEPRQLLDIGVQLEDWSAAVAHARTLNGVDPDRVIVWGTSFGGGHAIITAARDRRIVAAIAQCPFTDGLASLLAMQPAVTARLTVAALHDMVGAGRGKPPLMIATAGEPGATALMAAPDAAEGYLRLVPDGAPFRNEVAARVALRIPLHFPGRQARHIQCPIMFAVCEHDTVAPARATLRHARRAPRADIRTYPFGHFDIYVGEPFARAVADQIDFLRTHVPLMPQGTP